MKRRILTLIFMILGLCAYGQPEHPGLPALGNTLSELIPSGWRILSSSSGDLNKDGIEDIAFAIQNTLQKNLQPNDGLGIDTIDLNPRILGIYFGKSDGTFEKKLQSNTFIILQDSPTMDEPFDSLQILSNGVLQIDFHFWFSAGSWYISNHQYKFRFQNEAFELIGYESSETHRATQKTTNHSINFSTRKMSITTLVFDEETEKEITTEEWKKFELQNLKSIQSLGKPFEWKFQEIMI